MCGLPYGCTSPSERSTLDGLSSSSTKSAAFKNAGLPRLHGRVAGLAQQQRQPTDLEIGARADHELRAPHLRDQARPRLDVVRILLRRRRRFGAHELAADLGRERGPLRLAREDLDGRVRRAARAAKRRREVMLFIGAP